MQPRRGTFVNSPWGGGGRWRNTLTVSALAAALSLVVPLIGEGVAYTALAADGKQASLPRLPEVGGRNADTNREPKPLPHPAGARELQAHSAGAVTWPSADTVTVDLQNKIDLPTAKGGAGTNAVPTVRAGDTPVLISPSVSPKADAATEAPSTAKPGSVEVKVADRAQTQKANINGLLVGLKRADGGKDVTSLDVSLDYSTIADAYGGGWASRLRLVAMPACALTTPERAECRTRQPVASIIDPVAKKITGTVVLPAGGSGPEAESGRGEAPAMLDPVRSSSIGSAPSTAGIALGAVSEAGGSQGSYTATDLSSSGTWSQSASGAFTYSYPITTPPSVGGETPGVELSYNSQSVDGQTSARNSQASWIGDGWGYSPGFIERSYRACANAGIKDSGDLCWTGWNATLSLGSHSGELIRDASGSYHLLSDDGTRIERLTGAANGLWEGEYFKVTTTDGTAYYLGLNHAPGTGSDTPTNSAWGVPVYHPNGGDPCYTAAKGKNSQCDQQIGWRFNLDFVVDPHGNVQRYDWATETNRYAMGGGQAASAGGSGTLTPYTRGGQMTRLSYGYQLADAVAGREPSARVNFDIAERCVVSDAACKPENLAASTAKDWPDVPYDLACLDGWPTSGSGSNVCWTASPTFWSTKRLRGINTELRTEAGWKAVDRYDLKHVFSDAGGIIDPVTGKAPEKQAAALQSVMWLSEIRHTALDTSAGGSGQVGLDPVTFAGTEIDNRVDGPTPAAPPLYRPRIIGINTESGTSIAVTYRDAECSRAKGVMPASADSNTMACYPVYWTRPGTSEPIADWFQKTLVAKVTVTDNTTAASPPRETSYTYGGGAAWHRDDSDLTDDQYRTWNDFRGFRTVTTTTGSGPDPLSQTTVSYFQGMDGDYTAAPGRTTRRSVKLKNSLGEETVDSPWLAGTPQESVTYSQAGGTPIAKQLSDAPVVVPVAGASRARTAWSSKTGTPLSNLPPLESRRMKESGGRTSVLLSDGTWRTSRTNSKFDDQGRAQKVEAQPDVTSSADLTCTTTGYAKPPASNPMMLAYPSSVLTVAGDCNTSGSATTTVSDRRIVYDGSADPNNPGLPGVLGQNGTTVGNATATQSVKSYDAQGNATYQTLGAQAFDAYGRVVRSVDASGGVSLSTYTPATGVLPSEVATVNPLGWAAKSIVSPARGLVTRAVDANGRITDSTYDPLGRRTAVWLPGNSKDEGKPADRTFAYEMRGTDPRSGVRGTAPSVTTSTLLERGSRATSITIYDGFLQPRQTQATPTNGEAGRILNHTRYDSHGQVTKRTAEWFDGKNGAPSTTLFEEKDTDAPSQVRYVYDGTGRQIAAKLNGKGTELWQTVTSYPGADRTDTTPPSGGTPTTVLTDALGRTATSVLHGGAGAGDATTRYTYDQRGQLSTIRDSAGNTWSYAYDLQGRRVSQSDPDAGNSSTSYDDLGRISSTTDGTGRQLSFTYDILGRVIGRYEGTNTGDQGKLLASYTYDTVAKGYPTSATRYVGGAGGSAYVKRVNGYTARYQPTSTTTTVAAAEGKLANDYTQTFHYSDNLGLPAGVSYGPDGGLPTEKYGIGRSELGQVVSTGTDITPLLDLANYNPLGQLLRSQYGSAGSLMRTARTYDDITGRVTTSSVKFQEADANPISRTTYGYNQAGALTSISELQSSGGTDQAFDTQCFRYDGLNRLVEAWTDTWGVTTPTAGVVSQCNNSNPGPATIGGPAPYWQSFQYNKLGDRTQQVLHDVTGDTARDVTQTSSYQGDGQTPAARPNGVTGVTTRTGQATARITSALAATDGSALCMDVWGARTADGTAVGTWTCNDTGAQKWTRPGDGTLRALGKCAAPVGGTGGAGVRIELTACTGSDNQKWQDGGNGALVHTASTLCLEVPGWNQTPGAQLGLWYCNTNPNHRWTSTASAPTGPSYSATLTPQYDAQGNTVSRSTTRTGTLTSAVATGGTPLCLDADGARNANGTAVQTWTCNGTNAQDWTLGPDGTLKVLGACARPVGGQAGAAVAIELWACDGSDSQRWGAAADGSLVHQSGLCLDLPYANSNPGIRLLLWHCNQGSNQKWGAGESKPTAGSTQAFTYNAEGRTESVTTSNGSTSSTSRYLYDADGGLLIQRGPEGTILYLFGGAEQLTLSADGSTVSGNRYYAQPDGAVVVRSSSGALTYQLRDPQHTSALQVDATTKAISRRAFDPYGAPRGTSPSTWSDNRGYLGKPVDANSGLSLLGARNYDPVLGRFLTVDPVLMAGDPNQMGGYTYASNNPVNLTDADGLWPKWMKSAGKFIAGAVDQAAGWMAPYSPYAAGNNILAGVNQSVSQQTGAPVFPGITPMQITETPIADAFGIPHDDPAYVAGRVTEAVVEIAADGVGAVKLAAKGIRAATSAVREAGGIKNALGKLWPKKGAPKPDASGPKTSPTEPHIPKTRPADPKPPATPKAEPTSPQTPVGSACSFTPDTPVLMADGSVKPIATVKTGDQVRAADQWTATDKGGRKVTATWSHDDDDLVDLRVKTGNTASTIKTTANHPFWDQTDHKWVPAGSLVKGHRLTTTTGESVTVTAVRMVHNEARMYNLTVADLHTYYVLAGNTPVLVHNTCPTAYKLSLDPGAPKGSGANQAYQIRVVGSTEYHATGGGTQVWADGLDANTSELLDAKYVGNPGRSPFVPGGKVPGFIQAKIDAKMDDEFSRYAAVINDPGNPLVGLRVITNESGAVPYFTGLMQKHGVPGRVVVIP
ncbi:ricin-type beta-trefoil lectin domain protein [Kitasatospora hibisci]|uniref:ricin-type beta-trefoil lectin domain protein n=1 Tax=Kitasatospora hibisci TaxID=3369522 RepID=UPI003754792F